MDKYEVTVGTKHSNYGKTINDKIPSWTFANAWNASLDEVKKRKVIPRDYLWASALGKSQVDIYLELIGTKPSNDFDSRALRKFDAGVMWEWIVGLIAKRAGVYIDEQGHVKYQLRPDLLEVSGKYDLRVGGKRNTEMMEKMKTALEIIELPKRFIGAMDTVYKKMNFEAELPERILEVKSSSAYMYDAQYSNFIPAENHALQCLHYLLATGLKEGAVVYISKDDTRITEIPIWADDEKLLAKYTEIIEQATYYYQKKEQPLIEPKIIFDYDKGKFTDNWNIKYSAYLTMLYGFEHESEYQDAFKSKVASWNRVFTRIKKGDKMTKSNLEYIEEIKVSLDNFDDIVDHFRTDDLDNHEEGYVTGEE